MYPNEAMIVPYFFVLIIAESIICMIQERLLFSNFGLVTRLGLKQNESQINFVFVSMMELFQCHMQ